MMPDESTVLQELSKRFNGKLSRCEVYDANVCTTRPEPDRPWELVPVSGEPFSWRMRITYQGRKVTVLANSTYIHVAVSGTFAIRPFSVNAKQKVGFRSVLADAVFVGGGRFPVFTEDGKVSPAQGHLLNRFAVVSLIEQSGLRTGESLHFTKGEIGFYMEQPDVARTSDAISRMIELAGSAEVPEEELKLELLPVQFHPIIPAIKKWALADDSERSDLLAATPEVMLRALIDEVFPYVDAINSYLDTFRAGEPTEQAVALGWLAECAVEAKQYLDGRIGL